MDRGFSSSAIILMWEAKENELQTKTENLRKSYFFCFS